MHLADDIYFDGDEALSDEAELNTRHVRFVVVFGDPGIRSFISTLLWAVSSWGRKRSCSTLNLPPLLINIPFGQCLPSPQCSTNSRCLYKLCGESGFERLKVSCVVKTCALRNEKRRWPFLTGGGTRRTHVKRGLRFKSTTTDGGLTGVEFWQT